MRFAWVGCLICSALFAAGSEDRASNVNTRYKVETVIVSGKGWSTDFASQRDKRISAGLGKRITALIGTQLNPTALDDVANRLSRELRANVKQHVVRGGSPEYVKVEYTIGKRNDRFDASLTRFMYNSREGWTGAAESSSRAGDSKFTFGVVSNGDDLAERYAGITARYENAKIGTDRVHLRFEFDSFHNQWNNATLENFLPYSPVTPQLCMIPEGCTSLPPTAVPALALTSAPYRTRQNFQPSVTIELAEPLTLSVGVSFERFQNAYPAAHTEAANAVTADLRYHRQLEGSEAEQELDAGYDLRAATRVFDTDYVYARHRWGLQYTLRYGHHVLRDDVSGGLITGRAPLYDRYFLGNGRTLRGWNRFEIDPLGGNRMVHNSVEYRYNALEVFYDAGAVWDEGRQSSTLRHGIGVGIRHGSFELALAFPVRSGRADPVFLMDMNY